MREHQNHLRPSGVFRANLAAPDSAFQFGPFIGSQRQRHMARQYTTTDSVDTGRLETPPDVMVT